VNKHEKDDGNHGKPHPWRQICQEENTVLFVLSYILPQTGTSQYSLVSRVV